MWLSTPDVWQIRWLDDSAISSIYGPGYWVAFIITLVASWMPIINTDYGDISSLTVALLYTNWSALELHYRDPLFHGNRYRFDSPNLILYYQSSFEPATFPVILMGFLHGVAQLTICLYCHRNLDSTPRAVRCRVWLLLISLILPSLAVSRYMTNILFEVKPTLFDTSLVELNILTPSANKFLDYVPSFALQQFAFRLRLGLSDRTWVIGYAIWFFFSLLICDALTWWPMGIFFIFTRHPDIFPRRCFWVPCAPQTLYEPAQGFALAVAIVWAVYKFNQRDSKVETDEEKPKDAEKV